MRYLAIWAFILLLHPALFSQTPFTEANLPQGAAVSFLFFRDSLHGYASGDNGRVLKSADAGLTWTAISPTTTEWIRGLALPGNDTLLAIAEDGLLHMSLNDGASWTAKTISAAPLTHIRVRNHRVMATAADGSVIVNPHRSIFLVEQLGGDWANLDQFIWLNDS